MIRHRTAARCPERTAPPASSPAALRFSDALNVANRTESGSWSPWPRSPPTSAGVSLTGEYRDRRDGERPGNCQTSKVWTVTFLPLFTPDVSFVV